MHILKLWHNVALVEMVARCSLAGLSRLVARLPISARHGALEMVARSRKRRGVRRELVGGTRNLFIVAKRFVL